MFCITWVSFVSFPLATLEASPSTLAGAGPNWENKILRDNDERPFPLNLLGSPTQDHYLSAEQTLGIDRSTARSYSYLTRTDLGSGTASQESPDFPQDPGAKITLPGDLSCPRSAVASSSIQNARRDFGENIPPPRPRTSLLLAFKDKILVSTILHPL